MKRLLFLIACLSIPFLLSAQGEGYSNDVTYLSTEGMTTVVKSSGIHEKKKESIDMAVKSAFYTLFHSGVEGIENGKPLVNVEMTSQNRFYFDRFFNQQRYLNFIKGDYTKDAVTEKLPNKSLRSTVTVGIMLNNLIKELKTNGFIVEETSPEVIEEANLSIMVVPYKEQGLPYKYILQNDFDRRMAVGKVQSAFSELGLTTIDLEARVNAAVRSGQYEEGTADSNDKQLLMNSGADVYVVVDIKKDYSSSGNRILLSVKAYETATGNILASSQSWTNRFRTNALGDLCVYAIQDILTPPKNSTNKPFMEELKASFANREVKGNSVVLRINVGENSMMTMNTPVTKGNFANAIRQWVRKNAQNGKYHLQGVVDESMIFDNIQIPSKDVDGLPMDASQFGYNLSDYITEELEVPCDIKIDGNTIYIILQ